MPLVQLTVTEMKNFERAVCYWRAIIIPRTDQCKSPLRTNQGAYTNSEHAVNLPSGTLAMGRPQLYNSPEEKARAARMYRQAYKNRNATSINQKLFAVIGNSSRDFTETLCCALIQCEESEVPNALIDILAALDIIEDLELEARKVGSAVLTRVREVRVSLEDIIAWVRIDMDALDEAYEKGEIYHQYADSIYSAQSSCCVPPFTIQNKQSLQRVTRDADIITKNGSSTDVQRHRDGILKRRRELRLTKPSQEVLEIQRALAVALGYDEDPSEPETSDDENDALSLDLPSCLLAFKSIKDEMLVLIREPCAFTENLLLQYVKSLPDDVHGKGDTSIIQNAKTEVEHLLRRATQVQDQILIFCGVSTESRATESVSRFLSTTLAYIDDVQYFLDIEGLTELTVAHSMGELMYQKAGGRPSKRPKLIRHIHSDTVDQVSTRHRNFSLQANGNFSLRTSYLSASRPAIEEEQALSQQDIGVDSDPWNETQFSQEIEDPQSHLDGPTQARRRRTPG
ncbi:hypothetical protein BDR06DRAFT_966935, partial [Suillus hirtellus]